MDVGIYGFLLCIATFAGTCTIVNSAKLGSYSSSPENIKRVNPAYYPNDCLKPECIHTASNILSYIDESVNPCDDFYNFACGGFNDTTSLLDTDQQFFIFVDTESIMEKKRTDQLRNIIEADTRPNEPEPFRMVRNLYKSCMNEIEMENRGIEPLETLLEKLGGWPVIKGAEWNEDAFDWVDTIYELGYNEGLRPSYFFDISVVVDIMNTRRRVITIGQGTFYLLKEEMMKGFEDDLVQKYYNYVVETAINLGAPRECARAELEEAVRFEIDLATITPNEVLNNESALYHPMSLTELKETYSSVRWREIFEELVPSTVSLEDDDTVIVQYPSYVEKLEKLLKNTPKRTQANYLIWKMVNDVLGLVRNDEINDPAVALDAALLGRNYPAKSKQCIAVVSQYMPVSLGAMYVRRYVDPDTKQRVADMFDNIKRAFIKKIKKYKWMDTMTKRAALEKAEAINKIIGYPDEFLDNGKLENFYNDLRLSESDYFWNILKLQRFNIESSFRRLKEPVNAKDWLVPIPFFSANTYYNSDDNSVTPTAGALQGSFFNKNRPNYMNYGVLGTMIASSMIDGFDKHGSQYDKNGHANDWWSSSTEKKFRQRAKHVINVYNNYMVDQVGLKINGTNTLDANIADIGSAKIAYFAYEHWARNNSMEPKLPGVKYTPKQLFWISMANSRCEKWYRKSLRFEVAGGSSSPGQFRVIGTASNIRRFSEDFNCPPGSNMNPQKKWSVW